MSEQRKQRYILFFTLFQVMLGFGIVVPIMPYFVQELGANSFHGGLVVTVWAGAQFLFSPVWGALSERIGRRPVLLIGLAAYAVTFFMMAAANSIWLVILARFLGGIFSAATIPTAQAYLADTTEPDQRSGALAQMGAAMNLGFITGPASGTALAWLGLNYQASFAIAGLMATVTLLLSYFTLPEPAHRQSGGSRKGFSGVSAVRVALAGPESVYYLLTFAGTFGGSTLFSMMGYFIEGRLGAGPDMLGIAYTIQGTATILFQGYLVGLMSLKLGDHKALSIGLVAGVAGCLILVMTQAYWHVLLGMILVSLTVSLIRPLVTAIVSRRSTLSQGVTMGMQTSFDALGRTVAPTLAGMVFAWQDWSPFAIAMVIYAGFFFWTRVVWRREALAEEGPEPARS